ncbi:MAG: 16S rRNA (uracil(1498)-N(3))-methyltransferase [Deltaproteobacteria bacterium]|nr:16S rRNA (uracil(1498)-N(3))-methyltransferase [Deltaproteobacteria bacterium]
MRRFFSEEITPAAKEALIKGDEFVHLKKVLRLKKGDAVSLFDGRGLEMTGIIGSIGRAGALVVIQGLSANRGESPVEVTLIQALLKGDKPEFIIQKAAELGVRNIFFYPAHRSVPDMKKEKMEGRLKRWRKAAIEASKQCGRAVLPEVGSFETFKEAIAGRRGALKFISWESKEASNLKEVFFKRPPSSKSVAVVVGPEGGFTDEEIGLARGEGYAPVSLGPRLLRAETAAIAILSIIQYELGDMN